VSQPTAGGVHAIISRSSSVSELFSRSL
jgi:hypothetical protein